MEGPATRELVDNSRRHRRLCNPISITSRHRDRRHNADTTDCVIRHRFHLHDSALGLLDGVGQLDDNLPASTASAVQCYSCTE